MPSAFPTPGFLRSKSSSTTRLPIVASDTARFTAEVVLPSPLLALVTMTAVDARSACCNWTESVRNCSRIAGGMYHVDGSGLRRLRSGRSGTLASTGRGRSPSPRPHRAPAASRSRAGTRCRTPASSRPEAPGSRRPTAGVPLALSGRIASSDETSVGSPSDSTRRICSSLADEFGASHLIGSGGCLESRLELRDQEARVLLELLGAKVERGLRVLVGQAHRLHRRCPRGP